MRGQLLILTCLAIVSFGVFAKDIRLDRQEITIDLGDISRLNQNQIIETIDITQVKQTPRKVILKVIYKVPELYCARNEEYIATPRCDNSDEYRPGYQNCDPYISNRCVDYRYSTHEESRVGGVSYYRLKFKRTTNQNRSFQMVLKKQSRVLGSRSVFDIPREEQISLALNVLKGDFQKIKVRGPSIFRSATKIILD